MHVEGLYLRLWQKAMEVSARLGMKRTFRWLAAREFTAGRTGRRWASEVVLSKWRSARWVTRRSSLEERCEICDGIAVYRCPKCNAVVSHSHENDFVCPVHSFVDPIRDYDGARISGDGDIHPVIVL